MPAEITIDCPHCQRIFAIPVASAVQLKCPHCEADFSRPAEEAATRRLEQPTATLPPVSAAMQPETAAPNQDALHGTLPTPLHDM